MIDNEWSDYFRSMSLTIYRSSAGSGKTYTLAKEYLKLALRSSDYYQRILAVTFTNRAAEEMKERVLEFLIDISKGDHELIPVFEEELGKPADQIQQAAKESLTHLLHHYGYFNITTIDTFFHRVIRAFSREIGLQGSFGIELDTEKVAEFITSHVFQGVEENKQLRDWLLDFSMSKVMDGSSYEFKDDVSELARQLFKEEFKKLPKEQFEDEHAREKVKELKSELLKKKITFENTLKKHGQEFFEQVENSGIGLDEFSGGKKRTIPNFFERLMAGDFSINKTLTSASEDAAAWSTKTSSKRDLIMQFADQQGMPLLNKLIQYVEENEKDYLTAKVILRHLFTVGLITNLSQQLQEYKREEEVIMISDLPDFLSQIIDDSGSPFIYEKVGTRYAHFLIDEFQDTSQFQWNNFKPLLEESLANGNENVIVGDAKQSIYGWRGGDPTLLLKGVQHDLPAQIDPSKSTNWRSARNVVEFNNELFSKLPEIMVNEMGDAITDEERDTILSTYQDVRQNVAPKHQDTEGLVQVEFLDAERGEWKQRAMERTTEVIEQLLKEGHQLNDIAILVRSNKDASNIVSHVLEYRRNNETKVEVISAEGMLLANSSVVQMLLSAFKHLIHPEDDSILADLVFRYQQDSKSKYFETHADFSKLARGGLPVSFTKYKQHLLHLPILELTEVLIRSFELDKVSSEYAYLQAFQDAVLEFSKNHRSDLRLFLEWWEDESKKRSVQLTGALDAVEVITSHKSKGLQYPIVIVPFCNYRFDAMSQPTWYTSPYASNEAVPVDYKSELDKTHFSLSYKKDFAKWHLESLNVLYVAFTRAENGMYAFCESPPKKQEGMFGTASKLLFKYFDQEQPEGWNAAANVFHKGTLPIKHRENNDELMALKGYPTFKWSKKLTVRKTGKAYYDDEVEKQRNEGILLHQILSEIIRWDQTADLLDRYERAMQITSEDRKRYETLINNLWKDETIKGWFSGKGEVKTEVVVLPKDGDTKRMDRVVIDGNKATVIDFKSGRPKSEDNRQLKEYAALLSEMGYEVEGYLLYLKSGEVRKV
ncbi:UvrD-helicase domain-containing protein [Ekhidna sp.]|jgi:ATP-dependent helicase/nuclease subunit A|uniref:UvrD-helicase domain-containing protein n=1 Tax=Ekhidna sp. TaxID=2608089 RepID=UPI0032EF0B6F